MSIKSIIEAVKSGEMTSEAALQKLGSYMKTHPAQASAAVSQVLGMPEEPEELPQNVKNTLNVAAEARRLGDFY